MSLGAPWTRWHAAEARRTGEGVIRRAVKKRSHGGRAVNRTHVVASEVTAFASCSDREGARYDRCPKKPPADNGDAPCRATSNWKKLNSHRNNATSGTSARRGRAA